MYKIIGADGRQYGPISADQLRRWIAENRANAQTQVLAEGAAEWKLLGTMPEFAALFAPQVPPSISPVGASPYRKTSGFALWGMILGILALVCCCKSIFGALGLIFSLIGLSQINEHPDLYEGRGMAIAGIILSALGLVIGIILLLLFLGMGHTYPHYWYYRRNFI